jgi:Putative MetA-pathway of phenol degradation
MNQLQLTYAFARANASIDTSLVIPDARLNINTGIIDYTRTFSLLHNLAWIEATFPFANLNGSITNTRVESSAAGAGDSSYNFTLLLRGAPGLNAVQFETYKPVTTLGMSLTLAAPTGQYHADKILNLGSDRWSFKPEIAISRPFGSGQKWEFDGYANVYFFTDNTSYHGSEILRQQALPGLESHISYSFTSNLWASVDSRYAFRGDTFVDGLDQNTSQQTFILGSELNVALNSQSSLVVEVGRTLVHKNGPAYIGFALTYIYLWGKGYK